MKRSKEVLGVLFKVSSMTTTGPGQRNRLGGGGGVWPRL